MNEIIMLIFTGVIAASTVAYTVMARRQWKAMHLAAEMATKQAEMSHKQWEATRFASDIARYTLYLHFWVEFHRYVEDARSKGQPEAEVMARIRMSFLELGIEEAMRGVDASGREDLIKFLKRFDRILLEQGIDITKIDAFEPIVKRLDR